MSDQAPAGEIRVKATQMEEALVGALLIAPEMIREVQGIITAEQFYINRFGWVYSAICRLEKRGSPIDYLTVCDELDAIGKLSEVGGPAEITRLINSVPSAYNAAEYARNINETWVRGEMQKMASKIATMAHGEQWAIDEIQSKTLQLVQDCFAGLSSNGSGVYASQAISAQYDRMQAVGNGNNPGIETGFIDLDSILGGGPRRQDFVLVAGRPGMGKTALLIDLFDYSNQVRSQTDSGEYDVFFSLEMPTHQITDRLVAKYGVDAMNIRSGRLANKSEYDLYIEAAEKINRQNFIVDDTPGLSPSRLRSMLSKYASKHKLRAVYVDYIQLMQADGKHSNRVSEVSYISRQLKLIAREFNIVLYAGAQLSRATEQRKEKKPMLSDLRESGSLEQDADIVMFLYRSEMYYSDPSAMNTAELIIAKHRNGPTGLISLVFRKNLMKFQNASIHEV